jgi:hypothetical protein
VLLQPRLGLGELLFQLGHPPLGSSVKLAVLRRVFRPDRSRRAGGPVRDVHRAGFHGPRRGGHRGGRARVRLAAPGDGERLGAVRADQWQSLLPSPRRCSKSDPESSRRRRGSRTCPARPGRGRSHRPPRRWRRRRRCASPRRSPAGCCRCRRPPNPCSPVRGCVQATAAAEIDRPTERARPPGLLPVQQGPDTARCGLLIALPRSAPEAVHDGVPHRNDLPLDARGWRTATRTAVTSTQVEDSTRNTRWAMP